MTELKTEVKIFFVNLFLFQESVIYGRLFLEYASRFYAANRKVKIWHCAFKNKK